MESRLVGTERGRRRRPSGRRSSRSGSPSRLCSTRLGLCGDTDWAECCGSQWKSVTHVCGFWKLGAAAESFRPESTESYNGSDDRRIALGESESHRATLHDSSGPPRDRSSIACTPATMLGGTVKVLPNSRLHPKVFERDGPEP